MNCLMWSSPFPDQAGRLPWRLANHLSYSPHHPFGIGDGIALLSMAEQLGRPFKVFIHDDLLKVREIRPYALPLQFGSDGSALRNRANLQTRQEAVRLLGAGVTIVVFPGGAVATAKQPFGTASEWPWSPFVSRLIQSAHASVLPVYFEGQASRLFHVASRLSQTLRTSLLVSEFRRFAGSRLHAIAGGIIPFSELKHSHDRRALINELHQHVLGLGRLEGPMQVSADQPASNRLAAEPNR